MVILSLSVLCFFLVEIIHVELNCECDTCRWNEVRLECLK
jgi:hypothetical protein